VEAAEVLGLEHPPSVPLQVTEYGERCRKFFMGSCHSALPSIYESKPLLLYAYKRIMPFIYKQMVMYLCKQMMLNQYKRMLHAMKIYQFYQLFIKTSWA